MCERESERERERVRDKRVSEIERPPDSLCLGRAAALVASAAFFGAVP